MVLVKVGERAETEETEEIMALGALVVMVVMVLVQMEMPQRVVDKEIKQEEGAGNFLLKQKHHEAENLVGVVMMEAEKV